MLSRIKGALYGVAIGDALGGTTEFMSQAQVQRQYGKVTEIVGGGCWHLRPGETTDDTAMTIAVAQGILAEPNDPIPFIGEAFLRWAGTHPKDIGNIISDVFTAYRGDWYQAAAEVHQRTGGMTAGNGSLMRCLPVALAYSEKERVEEFTRLQSKMTHYDSLADEACLIYNRVAWRLLQDEPLREALRAEVTDTRYEPSLKTEPVGPTDGFVVNTMHWVVHFLYVSADFTECVQMAANRGGDSDTIGAIAGGLAGLDCGYEMLPKQYVEKIMVRNQLDELAVRLCALRNEHLAKLSKHGEAK